MRKHPTILSIISKFVKIHFGVCEDAASFVKHRQIFVIRVENSNTLMSLACFQSFSCTFHTSVRVASQVFFFVLLVHLSRETRGQFWSQFSEFSVFGKS